MTATIHDHLAFLYGSERAADLEQRLQALLDRFPPPRTPRRELPLSEADAVLITYADPLREPGVAPLQSLAEFAREHLRGAISAIHLLPFYPSSSDDGFAVRDFFAVDPEVGTWEEVARLGRDFDLMFDAVFNHLSAQGDWFDRFLAGEEAFRDFFCTVEGEPDLSAVVRPRALPLLTRFECAGGPRRVWTTFSADQVDLNFRNPEVLLAVIEVLLFYVARGARFIRLDAIAFLWKEPGTCCIHLPQTHRIIRLMRAVLDRCAPEVLLISETNVPHTENLSYFGDGGNEAQLIYNFALPPLVLHTLATGSAARLTAWARTLELPSECVTFFNFLASHDGIGLNPVRGILSESEIEALIRRVEERGGLVSLKRNTDGSTSPYELNVNLFDALSEPDPALDVERFLCAHAIQFALAGLPGIYFHSIFGSRGDRAGADASGIARRINRQKFPRAEFERELGEPGSERARVFSGLRRLLERRRASPAFAPTAAQRVLDIDPRVFAVVRGTEAPVLCLHNVTGQSVECGGFAALAPYEVRWEPV